MNQKIEMGKQYRTRDGREVRIYAVDGEGDFPVHGAYRNPAGWHNDTWTASGAFKSHCAFENDLDLIEVKPKITRTYWLVHGSTPDGTAVAETESEARGYRTRSCVGITGPHTVEFTEGDGL